MCKVELVFSRRDFAICCVLDLRSAYFLAKVFSELPVEIAYPTAFMLLQYWLCGWLATAGGFFFTLLAILLSCLCASSYGLLISCSLLDFKKSITFTSVSMLTIMLLSGFYVPIEQIPIWLRWASYLGQWRHNKRHWAGRVDCFR